MIASYGVVSRIAASSYDYISRIQAGVTSESDWEDAQLYVIASYLGVNRGACISNATESRREGRGCQRDTFESNRRQCTNNDFTLNNNGHRLADSQHRNIDKLYH